MSDALIRAENLAVHHAVRGSGSRTVVRALDGVTFEVRRGECLALVGPSGAGKSTLVRALLALEPVSAGRVLVRENSGEFSDFAQVCNRDRRAIRARFQVVFQDTNASLDPRWSVRSVLREALCAHARHTTAEIDARARELLVEVGLDAQHLERLPHELSGGQRQRVCLARALAVRPAFLALDEPVAALDALVQAQVLDLLVDLRARRGLTYLFVAHDLALVRWIADRVIVLDRGRIVEAGPTAQVLDEPRHATTRELVRARRELG